jgi:phage baseplate assembly protein W
MNGLSVKLPLTYNNIQGYAMNTNYLDLAKQNLKMVVLTEPGERVMIPTFGVGLKRRLFESKKNIESVKNEINTQVSKYVSYIQITNIDIFDSMDEETSSYDNSVSISITFYVKNFGLSDTLNIKIKG